MSKDYINLYRKKTQSLKCDNSQKNKLVDGAYGTTQIFHLRRHREITVNLIIDNAKEGLGTAIVYSWPKDHLHIGDYFRWKDQIFLVTNLEHNVFLDDNIYKFNARICNCEINYNYSPSLIAPTYNTIPGVFIGRTTQKLSGMINTRGDIPPVYTTNDIDVIIFSAAKIDKFESVLIQEEQWKVLEWDKLTNPPIVYATVQHVPTTMLAKEPEEKPVAPHISIYHAGVEYSFPTEDYYFDSPLLLEYTRNKDSVIIKMPYDEKIVSFDTKQNGEIITTTLQIGE